MMRNLLLAIECARLEADNVTCLYVIRFQCTLVMGLMYNFFQLQPHGLHLA